jgi:hypothetical protein
MYRFTLFYAFHQHIKETSEFNVTTPILRLHKTARVSPPRPPRLLLHMTSCLQSWL